MAETKAFKTTAGIRKGSVWGTPLQLGANHGFEFFDEGLEATIQRIANEQNTGSNTRRAGDLGNKQFRLNPVVPVKFETLDLWLALAMGTAVAPAQQINRQVADGAIDTGTDDLTSANANFTTADVGKRITVAGAGSAGALLDTTILAFVSESAVQLAANAGTTVAGAVTIIYDDAYLHALKMAEDLSGLFACTAFAKEIETHELDSIKVTGFEFESDSGSQAARLTLHAIGRSLAVNTSGGTNNNTTMASLTMIANRQRVFHNMLAFWLNGQADAALDADDAQVITNFKLSVTRPFVEDEIPAGASVIVEPVMDGHSIVTGSATYRVYRTANAARFAEYLAQSQLKASAIYTGPVVNGVTAYKLAMYLNAIQFNPFAPTVAGNGVVQIEAPFECHEVASSPTGFPSGYTKPLTIELTNGKSSNALA